MNERDRLIELLKGSETKVNEALSVPLALDEWLSIYADHLLANGVIVPPCKVGDTIYMLVTRHTVCFEYPNGKMQRVENQHTFIKETCLTKANFFKVIDRFGKTVFLTKEEAEKKLKELNRNG